MEFDVICCIVACLLVILLGLNKQLSFFIRKSGERDKIISEKIDELIEEKGKEKNYSSIKQQIILDSLRLQRIWRTYVWQSVRRQGFLIIEVFIHGRPLGRCVMARFSNIVTPYKH